MTASAQKDRNLHSIFKSSTIGDTLLRGEILEESCPARMRPATGAAEGCTKQPDTTVVVRLFEKPPYSHKPRGRLTICTIDCADRREESAMLITSWRVPSNLIAVNHRIIDLARLAELWREREVRLLACVPIDAASMREGRSHKAVNQFDFDVTKPCRVIVLASLR